MRQAQCVKERSNKKACLVTWGLVSYLIKLSFEGESMAESTSDFRNNKIALLVDGDNAQPSLLEKIIAEAGKYGMVTIRRIYGDWTTTNMNSWKNVHAIQPIQQFRYTIGRMPPIVQ
jgi:hypothetical protein